ncbi:MAG TPA: YggS family pyridoxal phosphate-dependent enzyme [Anaerohalosphaeraceae bacterium]|nr:YggS family pyridoxal phosphate-dependent enzyme [Anaerohalosphaeraceae bacterium]HQG04891.1 YggS family pyridoxal phosphate-dependent enzyme [Anaerohalosphaeraceae bacterium]HQI07426.1 YggS family pyridoxal phosphate-dependent enzyme [Anaerohalosphaeraceae bacterium]HQJ67674.1 YggS family pyridoxal phosphate-dependent enzyme [Anaerohalosphaeraceae bacterium]
MSTIAERIQTIQENIAAACRRCGREPDQIQIVVVTKNASLAAIQEVIRLGCTDLGENRVQHLKPIADEIDAFLKEQAGNPAFPKKVRWHMIGHLQRNKVKQTLQVCDYIHSVDTLRLAEEINTAAAKLDHHPNVLLQVNCSEEPQKYGAPVGAAIHLAEQIASMPNLRLIGLMTMAPLTMNKEVVRACFARCREIFEEIRAENIGGAKFKHLSMGMSQDYEIAVEEGATILRIGSAIFA